MLTAHIDKRLLGADQRDREPELDNAPCGFYVDSSVLDGSVRKISLFKLQSVVYLGVLYAFSICHKVGACEYEIVSDLELAGRGYGEQGQEIVARAIKEFNAHTRASLCGHKLNDRAASQKLVAHIIGRESRVFGSEARPASVGRFVGHVVLRKNADRALLAYPRRRLASYSDALKASVLGVIEPSAARAVGLRHECGKAVGHLNVGKCISV